MAKREEYEQQTETLIAPIVDQLGFELVDVEYVKEGSTWYLRVYIDKPGGIAVDDCEAVSRRFSEILDEKDYIPDAYIFEVSSPGLGRPLKKEKDFQKSMGEEIEIRTYRAIEKEKEFFGVLKAYDAKTITIEDESGLKKTFERSEVALIRLAIRF
ncbi:MAG: ribosome maturation factor RimP [Lachnospiraceae bacterium]|nr:ribosome maturation factor RimP [Lachnospiraceae bacterium]